MSKAFCGVGNIPKGFKKGSMKECVEKGQVRLYGLFKVDPKLLEPDTKNSKKEKKVKTYTLNELFLKLSKVNGSISRLEKIIDASKDSEEVANAKKELTELKKEKATLADYYKRTSKGEKIPKVTKKASKKTTKKTSKKAKK